MRKNLLMTKLWESLRAVLPISLIIVGLCLLIGVERRILWQFVIGDILVVLGLGFFQIGSIASTVAIAENIGETIVKKRNLGLFVTVAFLVGFLITVAEPALWVLADQFKSVVSQPLLILTVALGVGAFVILGLLRILRQIKLRTLFALSYAILFLFAIVVSWVNPGFIPIAFDSGGVTTGPMAVPFIMSLGFGISKARGDRASEEDSFGLIGIASIGPILAVLVLGIFTPSQVPLSDTSTTLMQYFLLHLWQMAIAILPFILFFAVFQVTVFRYPRKRVVKILIAFVYTYLGLILFLTGANGGLVNVGTALGTYFGGWDASWILIPLGMVLGFTVVAAEPSVMALNHQVESVSAGAISRKFMMIALSVGVSGAIGLALLRVVTGLSIWWILLPGYALTILLTFFTPSIFSAIAFDSGGAVSGTMTSAFLMPFALGAAAVVGTDILMDAFGLVAFVAMAPLITIQLLGLVYQRKMKRLETALEETEILTLSEGDNETIDIDRPTSNE